MPAEILGTDNPEHIEEAALILREGGLVAFPTDTVYGVAALADPNLHSAKLQEFKGGRREPFSLHLPDVESALKFAAPLNELAEWAVKSLSPRGVTVIVANGTSQTGLGLRVVQDESGSRFLRLADGPVVATSANHHAQPPLSDPDEIANLPGLDAVLSAGVLPVRAASSVVRLVRCGLEILREGAVKQADLQTLFTQSIEFVCLGNLNRSAFAHRLIEAMQQYYGDNLATFVPAYELFSSGLIAHPQASSPESMQRAAQAFHTDLASHAPTRFSPRNSAERTLVSMGDDVRAEVQAVDQSAKCWKVLDPMGGPPEDYVTTTRQVRAQVQSLLARTAMVRPDDAALEATFDKLFSSTPGDDS